MTDKILEAVDKLVEAHKDMVIVDIFRPKDWIKFGVKAGSAQEVLDRIKEAEIILHRLWRKRKGRDDPNPHQRFTRTISAGVFEQVTPS